MKEPSFMRVPPANSQAFMTMLEIERPGSQDRIWRAADVATRCKCERDTVLGMTAYDAWFHHYLGAILYQIRVRRGLLYEQASEVTARQEQTAAGS